MCARLVAIVTGLWLMFAPAVLGHVDTTAGASDRIVGPAAAALALMAIWGITRPLRWGQLPLGAWLIVAPWVLGFPTDAALSALVAGLVLIGTAFVRGTVSDRTGGSWSSLREPMPGC